MSKLPELTDSKLELEERVALLTFQRDDVRNALTGTGLIDDIVNTIEWSNHNPMVSVLIITGEGKAFSSGGNIKQMRDREGIFGGSSYEIQEQYRRGIQRIPLALHSAEVPTIAAVNGVAAGAGMDTACMCDIRIGSTMAKMGQSFINLGLIPGDGGAWFLQRLIGYQKAAELTLTGRMVDAEELLELGLLLNLVEPNELIASAKTLAHSIASKPPQTVRFTKQLLKSGERQNLPDFLANCAATQAICHQSKDHIEAVNAFLERRDPKYQGK
ncbi:MAG: enoyl-CoA hydratase [Gammaproteobacteria bacterium]|nr:enoyl-CoA hydratase [Gammaproteobacteria bacterium]